MKTLIKSGTIITSQDEFEGDILINGEKIVAIGMCINESADTVIDAKGKYIVPGGVDQHTHFSALCNVGSKDTAGYETTDAVVAGGTTTIIDYAPQDPGKGLLDSIDYRINVRAKQTCVDFALHAMITEVMDSIFDEIKQLPDAGISSIKCFMAYNGSPLHVDDGTLFKVLNESKKYGITVFVHAENGEIIDTLQRDDVLNGRVHPKYHAYSRPTFVETEATKRAIFLAEETDSPIFIVHVTCKDAADAIREAQGRGQKVLGETCTHYLMLDNSYLEAENVLKAAKYVCSPALREKDQIEAIWKALSTRTLTAVASDHCGIGTDIKEVGKDDYTQIANGSPGAADRLNILWTYGVISNKISKQEFVQLTSANPAKICGLFPEKGHIGIGADADLAIIDPDYRGVVRHEDNPNGVDYNMYEGFELKGRVEKVLLRGKVVAENGKFIGEYGQGKYLRAKTFAAAYTGLDNQ